MVGIGDRVVRGGDMDKRVRGGLLQVTRFGDLVLQTGKGEG